VAIYHLSTKPVSRGAGRSATAASAYRAADKVHDLSTDQVFDYTRKRGVEHAEIVLPTAAAKQDINWARDRQALWNAAEAAEKRKDARVAREYEVALPHELTRAQRVELVRSFAGELANRYGVAVDFAIHRPHREGDERNHHAHILTTTRELTATGLGAKTSIEWSDQDRFKKGLGPAKQEVKAVRERWAEVANEHLREHGIAARIDHRTLEAQGIDRVPTTHLGVAVWGMERRGIESEVGARVREQQRAEAQQRLERAAEMGRLEREGREVTKSILDLSADISVALKERDRGLAREPEASPAPAIEREGLSATERLRVQAEQVAERLAAERAKTLPARQEAERQRELELKRQLELEKQRQLELERGKDLGLER
jgi:ATP-dependent exoDNAse (exonuclease V) alpha subunit